MSKPLSSVNPLHESQTQTQTQSQPSVPTCIICLETTPPPTKFTGSCKCQPEIHIKCMDAWLTKNSKTCPICRQIYPETDAQKTENLRIQERARKEDETVACALCCYICCVSLCNSLLA